MKQPSPRRAQRASPHTTAANFREEMRPTLLRYEQEFLAYDPDGAYRVVSDDKAASEVQSYLEDAEEMRPVAGGRMKPFPFNPKTTNVNEVVDALARKYLVERGELKPPFFLPGPTDYSALDPSNVIACGNGLLDISSRTLYEPSPQFFTRTALPIVYDADARPVRWLTFLSEVLGDDRELILLMQQMFGYLITSETGYQKIFYFRGVSNSGKSTTMRVLQELIGERNIVNTSIADLAERSTLYDMIGCTLAKITDMNTDDRQKLSEASSTMNRISGEDPVHIFRKFKDGLDMRLPVRFLMAGNQFPNFGEHATALARRLKVIPFNVSFEDRADPDLTAKLLAELPGILNWALDGLDQLREAGGFVDPEASKDAKAEVLNSGDPIRSFVADECELGDDFECSKDDLFHGYQLHCQSIGVKNVLAKPKFFAAIKTAYNGVRPARPRTDDGGREHIMVGICMKDVERAPSITFKLNADLLSLGWDRTDPEAIMRDASGRPIEMRADEFED